MYICCFGFAALGCVLAWYYAQTVVTLSTALIGSLMFMKGLASFLGNYPDISVIYTCL